MPLNVDTASTEADALKRFRADTAEHVMTVLHNDGLYRHLRFAKPGTGIYRFDLITWPGHLTITGDMGTYTFARTRDMLEFFRHARRDYINAYYWSEKLLGAEQGRTQAQAYSEAAYRSEVIQNTVERLEWCDLDADQARRLWEQVWEDLLDRDGWDYPGGHYETARDAIDRFEFGYLVESGVQSDTAKRLLGTNRRGARTFRFEDTYEWNLTGYDFMFLWACYAIQHGIHEYDARQESMEREAQKEKAATYA